MSFTNAKKQADHGTDHDKFNNGGLLVQSGNGAKPSQKVGDKQTEDPTEGFGVNKPVEHSESPGA